jgi:glucose/arabinose dehydrogenase
MSMKLAKAALLFTLAALFNPVTRAQVNVGEQKPEASLPFTMTTVATFKLPWRLAFLPDGRMLITEKVGPVWLVSQKGEKIKVDNTPPVYYQGQSGMHGVFLSPNYSTEHSIYLNLSHLCRAGRLWRRSGAGARPAEHTNSRRRRRHRDLG